MIINIKGKEVELKFTFNSFKYMAELDLSILAEIENKPFKVIPMVETLLLGATNNDPKVKFTVIDVNNFIEEYVEENSLTDLIEELMSQLQNSSFFKSLQKNQDKK